jgi:hypothetical protein
MPHLTLASVLAFAGLALIVPSAVVLYRHPEWRDGEDDSTERGA